MKMEKGFFHPCTGSEPGWWKQVVHRKNFKGLRSQSPVGVIDKMRHLFFSDVKKGGTTTSARPLRTGAFLEENYE